MELFLYFSNSVVVTCNGLKHRFIVNLYIIMGPAVLCLLLVRHNDNIQTDRLIFNNFLGSWDLRMDTCWLKKTWLSFLRSLYYFLYVVQMGKWKWGLAKIAKTLIFNFCSSPNGLSKKKPKYFNLKEIL